MALQYSTVLDILKIDQNQAKKEVTANENSEDLALSIAGEFAIDLGAQSTPFTVPYTPQGATPDTTALRAIKYTFTGTLGESYDVIHPAKRHFFLVENAASDNFAITVKVTGQTGTVIEQNDTKLLYCNGTDVFEITVGSGAVSSIDDLSDVDTVSTAPVNNDRLVFNGSQWVPNPDPFRVSTYTVLKPGAGQQILKYTFVENVDLPANLAGSEGHSDVAANAASDYDVLKNAVSIGTISFAPAATIATFVLGGGASFVAGDRLTVTAPSPQDSALSGIAITILGTKAA